MHNTYTIIDLQNFYKIFFSAFFALIKKVGF